MKKHERIPEKKKGDRSEKLRKAGFLKRTAAMLTAAGLVLTASPVWVRAENAPAEDTSVAVVSEVSEKDAVYMEDMQSPEPEAIEAETPSFGEADAAETAVQPVDSSEAQEAVIEEVRAMNAEDTEESLVEAESLETAAIPAVIVESLNADTGAFTIRISGVDLEAGESIIVPTWQDAKQADIVWYTAEKDGADYIVRSNVSAHGYRVGTYNIHVYRRSKSGQMNFLVKTTMDINPTAEKLETEYTGLNNNSLKLTIRDVKTYGTEKQVEFAVWSAVNGQDDLKWYKASKSGSSWTCTVPLGNHKGKGIFNIHTYVKTRTDAMVCVKKSAIEVSGPSAERVSAKIENGKAILEASGIRGFESVESVQFAVWSVADGQDDLKWFGQNTPTGSSYIQTVSMTGYKKYGTYNVHVYARETDGTMILLGTTTMDYTKQEEPVKEPACASYSATVSNGKEFTVTASGITAPFTITEVVVPIWHKADQSDLIWYKPEKSGDTYIVKSDISRHGNQTGTYQAHLYVKDTAGKMYCIGRTSFKTEAATKTVEVTARLNADQSVANLALEGHTAPAGMKDVSFAVWSSENGQDDLKWYIATETAGVWKYSVKISDHRSTGEYLVHCYMKTADGKSVFLGNTTFEVEKEKGPDNEVTVSQPSDTECVITIKGANYDGVPATEVVCPTWSNEGGQDDLIWYKTQKKADGSYTVTIKRNDHAHDGLYITDVYVKNAAGKQKMVQRVTYQMKQPAVIQEYDAHARAVMRNIIYAVETGGQVYGNNRYDCFVEAYTNSSKETAITIGAGGWFANEAKTLLNRIRTEYPNTFAAYDTAEIGEDLDNENWTYYGGDRAGGKTILKGSEKAKAIQAIINSAAGRAVQDSLIDEQMIRYTDQALALGVTDVKARMFCANVEHLGGYSAMVRIVNYCKEDDEPITVENLFNNMREREAGGGNTVGADIYATRHKKVVTWLNTYM